MRFNNNAKASELHKFCIICRAFIRGHAAVEQSSLYKARVCSDECLEKRGDKSCRTCKDFQPSEYEDGLCKVDSSEVKADDLCAAWNIADSAVINERRAFLDKPEGSGKSEKIGKIRI